LPDFLEEQGVTYAQCVLTDPKEKKGLLVGSLSYGTRKKIKKKHFHNKIVKTLKNIKGLHSKKAWL
jgi:hypothetical protein